MIAYHHQQVFSTGEWWDFEEVPSERGRQFRRMFVNDSGDIVLCDPVELRTDALVVETSEQQDVLNTFARMLRDVTADGGRKRAAGDKPRPWWRDPSHEVAIFSHLARWKRGERRDPDSGAHPLVHLAWRALAIAYQEGRG